MLIVICELLCAVLIVLAGTTPDGDPVYMVFVPATDREIAQLAAERAAESREESRDQIPTTTTTTTTVPDPCERHRDHADGTLAICPLIAPYFDPPDLDRILRIVDCESRGDRHAVNPSSGTTGAFQIHPGWIDGRWGPTMQQIVGSSDRTDVDASARFASWLIYHTQGSWSHFACDGIMN